MTKRRGFAVCIADRTMLTPLEAAALGTEDGPEFVFALHMGESENAKAYYFDRRGFYKLLRTFARIDHWITNVEAEDDVLDDKGDE